MNSSEYSELLKDPKWIKLAKAIRERDCFKCQDCHEEDTGPLHVHHLYYCANENMAPWEYPQAALITLCEKCHKARHWDENLNKIEIPELSLRGLIRLETKSFIKTGSAKGAINSMQMLERALTKEQQKSQYSLNKTNLTISNLKMELNYKKQEAEDNLEKISRLTEENKKLTKANAEFDDYDNKRMEYWRDLTNQFISITDMLSADYNHSYEPDQNGNPRIICTPKKEEVLTLQ